MPVILEPLLKRELTEHSVPVPAGRTCRDLTDVACATDALGVRVVVKAVVPIGRKGKAGAVSTADGPNDACAVAARLFGSTVHGFPVDTVLVEQHVDIRQELYAAVLPDGARRCYTLVASQVGGVDVEQSAEELATLPLAAGARVPEYACRALAKRVGLTGPVLRGAGKALAGMARLALRRDMTLLEVNPLAVAADGRVYAAGALGSVDEHAMHRHLDLAGDVVGAVERLGRPLTPLELEIDRINRAYPEQGDIRFQEFADGDLGFMVMGGGAGLVSLDELQRLGGRPATFFDMTAGDVEDKICAATQAVLAVERLRGLLIGVNISAFAPVPIRVNGIARALKASARDFTKFPVVVRLAGPGDDEAVEIMRDFSDVDYFRDEVTLEEAVAHFVRRVGAVTG